MATYQPKKGDRIIVRRTPGKRGPVGVITGTVLDVRPSGVLDFRDDDGRRVYLATNEQMAKDGVKQTIELAPRGA
jgi:hypothetical protein